MSDRRRDLSDTSDPDFVKRWQQVLAALQPLRALQGSEVSTLYVDRPRAPSSDLAKRLRYEPQPNVVKVVLTGARGSGKTTELTRIAESVKSRFFIVKIDVSIALPAEGNTLALVVLIGAAALHALEAARGAPDPEATPEQPLAQAMGRVGGLAGLAARFGAFAKGIAPLVTWMLPGVGGLVAGAGEMVASTSDAMREGSRLRAELAGETDLLGGKLSPEKQQDAEAVVEAVIASWARCLPWRARRCSCWWTASTRRTRSMRSSPRSATRSCCEA